MVAGEAHSDPNEPAQQAPQQAPDQQVPDQPVQAWSARELGLTVGELGNPQTVQKSFLKTLAGETFLPTDQQWDAFQVAAASIDPQHHKYPQALPNYALAREQDLCRAVTSFADDIWKWNPTERTARYEDLEKDCIASRRAAVWLQRLKPALAVDLDKVKGSISAAPADIKSTLEDLSTALRDIFVRRSLSAAMRRSELMTGASKNPVSYRKAATYLAEKLPEVAALDFEVVKKLQVRPTPAKKSPSQPNVAATSVAAAEAKTEKRETTESSDPKTTKRPLPFQDRSSQPLTKPDVALDVQTWLLIGGLALLGVVITVCVYLLW